MAKKQVKPTQNHESVPPASAVDALSVSHSGQSQTEIPPSDKPDEPSESPTFACDPFELQCEDFAGYKIRLLHSRKSNQYQIKFGSGSTEDRPPEFIRQLIRAPEGQDGPQFRWNNEDRAWALDIDPNAPMTSRQKAEAVFVEVVHRVGDDLGRDRPR